MPNTSKNRPTYAARRTRQKFADLARQSRELVASSDSPLSMLPPEPFLHRAVRELGRELQGHLSTDQARIDELHDLCRAGNPFPLIAYQWPELIIVDPAEFQFFEGEPGDDPKNHPERAHPTNPKLRLDSWQRRIIAAFFDESLGEIFVKGCTKAGKGASIGIAANLYFDCHNPGRIFLTSQRYDHAVANIFGEIRMWRRSMQNPGEGMILAAGIGHHERHYMTILNPAEGEGFSGQHGPHTCFIMDEASAIADEFYLDSQKQAERIVALANPRVLSGWFRDGFRPLSNPDATETCDGAIRKRLCVTVGGMDCLNVRERRLNKAFAPRGGIDIDHPTAGRRRWEHNQPIPRDYWNRVKPLIPNQIDYARFLDILATELPLRIPVFAHGKFPTEDPELQVILSSWLARHEQAWRDVHERGERLKVDCFGLDVAASLNGDESVLAAGGIGGCENLHAWRVDRVHEVADRTIEIAYQQYGIDLRQRRHPVCVDIIGYGQGTAERLEDRGVWVIWHRGNDTAELDPRTYGNVRAEAYAMLGRRLNPADFWKDDPWALFPDAMLREELVAPEKIYGNDGLRFHVMKKEDIKKKLNPERSPDRGDAVAMLYRAVRMVHNVNEWVMSQEQPLVCYPDGPVTPKGDEGRRDRMIEAIREPQQSQKQPSLGDADFDWAAALSGSPSTPAAGSRQGQESQVIDLSVDPVNQQIEELVAWSREEGSWAGREFGR